MLKILRRIVQEVTTAENLTEALDTLIKWVIRSVDAEAVSIFLLDNKTAEYVLAATDGLNRKAVGKARISIDIGLIGLVGRREEPINLDNATEHEEFHQNLFVGEDKFKSFLGVPVIQHRKLYGVLTLQHSDQRFFDDPEEAFLVTLAAQLGGIIAHAEATGELAQITAPKAAGKKEVPAFLIAGIGSVPGVGIGTAVIVYPPADIDAVPQTKIEDVDAEIQLFLDALKATQDDIKRLSRRMKSLLPADEHSLFDVYSRILDKKSLGAEVAKLIAHEHLCAQAALAMTIKRYIQQFESMEDDYLRERASDFRDLGRRILSELQTSQVTVIDYPKKTILIGEEVSASALAEVPEGQLMGIVSGKGSSNSHVSILARALNVPTVMGAKGLKVEQLAKRAIIVDGYYGQVHVSPVKKLLVEYKKLAQEEVELNQSLVLLRDKPAETTDNYRIALKVNVGLAKDAGLSMSVGAEGVGLYRSEVPFMTRDRFPSEEEQRVIYRQILKAFAPNEVTMRTLDIGGDKPLPYFPVEEENPFLGWRGIRVTLDHPDLFLMQVRAMMLASEGLNNLCILLPMVTAISEIEEASLLIEQAYSEVLEEGVNIAKPKFGVMIEVPAAVYQSRQIAKLVDFISVGTNDLTQYLLAVDRNNARVANLYDALHPAVLRSLMIVVEGARASGVKVSVCGEMASDPVAVILLLAMGFDELSMNSSGLPRVKWVIRNFSIAHARKLLSHVLEMHNATEIRFYLQTALEEEGLGGLIRAGNK